MFSVSGYPVEMDADGNLLYMSDGQSMEAYEYDTRNRLRSTGKAKYRYDWKGERIALTWRGKTTRYVVDDSSDLSRVLMELDENGAAKAYYVYGLGLIGREDNSGQYLSYHSDIRGSTTLLSDEQSRITDRYEYGPYGKVEHHEGTTHQPYQYNGRDGVMTDPNGLYYMRARYYHPDLGRFLNRDIIKGDLADGQTLNRYAYVNGDPIRYIDPLGLDKEIGLLGGSTGELSPKITELQIKLDDLAEKHLLPQFREIDPNLKPGYTGSFKTGTVGNPNKPTFGQPIDMKKYDIDYFIESDILHEKYGNSLKANPDFRKLLSETPGFEGLKPNKQGFSIKFNPSIK